MSTLVEALTPADVATILGVSTDTVHRMCHRGDIPHRRVGRTVRFHPVEFDAWLRGEQVAS